MSLKNQLVEVCHKVYQKGFVAAFDGNLSVRTPDNTFLITRSAICKGDVTEDDMIEIDAAGKVISGKGKISTEYKIHLYIYNKRKDINAVVHCHPVYATAFASSNVSIDKPFFPEVVLSIGRIPLCKYSNPSTSGMTDGIEPYVDFSNVFLLQNHGAVTTGKTLLSAFYMMEKLEHTAKTLFIAKTLGGVNTISDVNLKKLYSISEETYGIHIDKRNKY